MVQWMDDDPGISFQCKRLIKLMWSGSAEVSCSSLCQHGPQDNGDKEASSFWHGGFNLSFYLRNPFNSLRLFVNFL